MEDIAGGQIKTRGPIKEKKKQANFYKPSISPLKNKNFSFTFQFFGWVLYRPFAKGAPFFLRPPYFFILQPTKVGPFFFFYQIAKVFGKQPPIQKMFRQNVAGPFYWRRFLYRRRRRGSNGTPQSTCSPICALGTAIFYFIKNR